MLEQNWKEERKNPKHNTIFSRALFLYSLLFCECVCVCACTTCRCLRMWNWNKIQLHCVEHLRAHMCGAKALHFPWCFFFFVSPPLPPLPPFGSILSFRMCLVCVHRSPVSYSSIIQSVSWVSIRWKKKHPTPAAAATAQMRRCMLPSIYVDYVWKANVFAFFSSFAIAVRSLPPQTLHIIMMQTGILLISFVLAASSNNLFVRAAAQLLLRICLVFDILFLSACAKCSRSIGLISFSHRRSAREMTHQQKTSSDINWSG